MNEWEDIPPRPLSILNPRDACLRGLKRLYLFVDDSQCTSLFDQYDDQEFLTRFVVRAGPVGVDKLIREIQQERMNEVQAAFPVLAGKLREVGIELMPRREWREDQRLPRLILYIELGKPNKGASFQAKLRLEQEIQMARDPSNKFVMTTWDSLWQKRKYKHYGVRWVLDMLALQFLHDYCLANGMEEEVNRLRAE